MRQSKIEPVSFPKERIKQKIWHGLFPQDDISERSSTESRSDLSFEDLRQEPMAEYIARLKETASQTLKVQITATGPYRYRLEGMVHALFILKNLLSHQES